LLIPVCYTGLASYVLAVCRNRGATPRAFTGPPKWAISPKVCRPFFFLKLLSQSTTLPLGFSPRKFSLRTSAQAPFHPQVGDRSYCIVGSYGVRPKPRAVDPGDELPLECTVAPRLTKFGLDLGEWDSKPKASEFLEAALPRWNGSDGDGSLLCCPTYIFLCSRQTGEISVERREF
jgi:hypothetical protein